LQKKWFVAALLMIGVAVNALAAPVAAPEIDPATGGAAIALVAGALLVIRARRRK
jgi:hypothetical protein